MDEKLIIVHGVSCIDGVEYIEMFATDAVVQIFLDDHVEREWLVVCPSLPDVQSVAAMADLK